MAQIKCKTCSKAKPDTAYSKKRIQDLQAKMAQDRTFNPANKAHIVCMQCAPAQVTELFCNGCDKWKGLQSFSKAQRRNPDRAKCWPCMEEQLNTEPGASSDNDSGDENNSDYESSDDEGGTTIAGPLSTLAITNDDAASSTTGSGGVALAPSKTSSLTPPHLKPASVTSSAPRTVYKDPGQRENVPVKKDFGVKSNNSNFAKVKAKPQKFRMDAAQQERERERAEEAKLDDVGVEESESDSD